MSSCSHNRMSAGLGFTRLARMPMSCLFFERKITWLKSISHCCPSNALVWGYRSVGRLTARKDLGGTMPSVDRLTGITVLVFVGAALSPGQHVQQRMTYVIDS